MRLFRDVSVSESSTWPTDLRVSTKTRTTKLCRTKIVKISTDNYGIFSCRKLPYFCCRSNWQTLKHLLTCHWNLEETYCHQPEAEGSYVIMYYFEGKHELTGASSPNSRMALFADDTSLFHLGKRYQLTIQNDINSISKWFAWIKPTMNTSKCEAISKVGNLWSWVLPILTQPINHIAST